MFEKTIQIAKIIIFLGAGYIFLIKLNEIISLL